MCCEMYEYCRWGEILWVPGRRDGTTAVVGESYHWGAGGLGGVFTQQGATY